jgi:hypothetical protein
MFNWLLHIASIVGLVLGLVRRAVRAVEAPGGNAEAALMASLRQRYPEAPQPWLDLVARNSMLAASAFAESAAKPPVRPEFIPQRQETEPRREGSFRVVSEMPSIERPRFADVPGRARPTWRWRVIEEDRPLVAVRAERDTTPRTVPRARFHEAIATDVEAARFDVPRDLELPHQGFETRDEPLGCQIRSSGRIRTPSRATWRCSGRRSRQ